MWDSWKILFIESGFASLDSYIRAEPLKKNTLAEEPQIKLKKGYLDISLPVYLFSGFIAVFIAFYGVETNSWCAGH